MKKILFVLFANYAISCHATTLSDEIQHSMMTNPDIASNVAQSLAAKHGVDEAKGAYYPSIEFNTGYGREETQNPTTTALDDTLNQRLWRRELGLELNVNIFDGGAILYEYKRNKFLHQAQVLKTQGVAEDLALEITNLYLDVLKAEKLYALSIDNVEAHETAFTMIKKRAESGFSRKAEIDQANSRLYLAKANKVSVLANLREARINYLITVGKWPKNLRWPTLPGRNQMPKNIKQAIQKGLDNHPTVRSSYADIKEAKAQYSASNASFYPKVDLILNARRDNNLNGLIGKNYANVAMIRLKYNLYRGGADLARSQKNAYKVQEAYEVKNKSLLDLKQSLRLSWNAYLAAGDRIPLLEGHVSSARATRKAYTKQFQVGKRSLIDLLDSQNEYYQAKIQYTQGVKDDAFSRFRLINGMGCLTRWLNIKLPTNVVNKGV